MALVSLESDSQGIASIFWARNQSKHFNSFEHYHHHQPHFTDKKTKTKRLKFLYTVLHCKFTPVSSSPGLTSEGERNNQRLLNGIVCFSLPVF